MFKRSLLGLLILSAFVSNTNAEEIPYSLEFKYITRFPYETTVQKVGEDLFLAYDELSNFKGFNNKELLKKHKFDGKDYVKIQDFAVIKDMPEAFMLDGTLKAEFMPKQEWNLAGNKYTIKPTGEPINYFNYDLTYKPQTQSIDGLFNVVASNGKGKYLDLNFGYSNKFNLGSVSYNIHDQENKNKWTIGSAFSQNGLGNSMNFFGIKLESDHISEPTYNDRVNTQFTGKLDTESVANLFINDTIYRTYKLRPGEFSFLNVSNNLTYDGQAKLVVKDINGNEKVITQTLFGAPLNLAAGKSKYGFDFGMHKNDETKKFDSWVLSGNYAYGITDKFTVKGDFQASQEGRNLNLGVVSALPGFTLSPTVSFGTTGNAIGVDALTTSTMGTLNLIYRKYNNYSDGGSLHNYSGDTMMAAGSVNVFGKPIYGSIAKQGENYTYGVGTSFELSKETTLSVDYRKSSITGDSIFATLKFNFGGRVQSVQYNSRENTYTTGFSNSSNLLNRFNYNATVVKKEEDYIVNADFRYPTEHANYGVYTAYDTMSKQSFLQFNTSGSVLYHDNKLNFGRYISDSILYFDTGYKDVVFKDGSGYAGTTGKNGVSYMPINSYSDIKMNIDTENTDELLVTDRVEYTGNALPRSLLKIKPKVEKIE